MSCITLDLLQISKTALIMPWIKLFLLLIFQIDPYSKQTVGEAFEQEIK